MSSGATHIGKASEATVSSSLSLSGNIKGGVPFGGVLESEDIEELKKTALSYEEVLAGIKVDEDLKDLVFFPKEDVSVQILKRAVRTQDTPIVPLPSPRGVVSTPRGQNNVDGMFKVFYEELTSDWRVVKHNYGKYGGNILGKQSRLEQLPSSSLETMSTFKDSKQSKENVPLFGHFTGTVFHPNVADKRDKSDREQNRKDVFEGYFISHNNDSEFEFPSDPRCLGLPSSPKPSLRVMVRCKHLRFGQFTNANIEPFFVSVALFDVVKQRKLSETFYFDLPDNPSTFPPTPEKIASRSCIFSISDMILPQQQQQQQQSVQQWTTQTPVATDIFVVIRVEKLLSSAEGDSIVEPYTKQSLKPKEREKLQKEIDNGCKYLWKYRQGFCWSYCSLFNADGSLLPSTSTNMSFTRIKSTHNDKEACEYIVKSLQKSKAAKKPASGSSTMYPMGPTVKKPILGDFVFDFVMLKPENFDASTADNHPSEPCLDPSLLPIKQSLPPQCDTLQVKEWVREMREFKSNGMNSSGNLVPHTEVIHDLYIYPETVNFNKHKESGIKNIALSVSIKEKHRESPLKAVYAKGTHLRQNATCTITYNKKQTLFYDEIKIKLPTTARDEQLMLQFHNVQCPVKNPDHAIEKEIGIATLPLYNDQSRILAEGNMSLPVIYDHKWLDSKKPLVAMGIKLESTLSVSEERMRLLFELYQLGVEESFLCTPLKEVVSVPDSILISFFPPLLRILFSILSKPPGPSDVQSLSFSAILHLLSVVTKYSPPSQSLLPKSSKNNSNSNSINNNTAISTAQIASTNGSPTLPPMNSTVTANTTPSVGTVDKKLFRSSLLESYVNYQFYNTADTKDIFYHLTSVWLKFARDSKFEGIKELAAFSWFFFDIIIKSLALHLFASASLGKEERSGVVKKEFLEEIRDVIKLSSEMIKQRSFGQEITPVFNSYLGFFVKDLFSLLDRGFVLSLVHEYIAITSLQSQTTQKSSVLKDKFTFLRIICDYEHFIPLNIPISHPLLSINNLTFTHWKKHFLIGILLQEVATHLNSSESEVRKMGIVTLRDLLWRHDTDERYSSRDRKEIIAGLYFPFVLVLLEKITDIREKFDLDEKRDIFVCFLFICKNCNRNSLLRKWWSIDASKNQLRFLTSLSLSLTVFDHLHQSSDSGGSPPTGSSVVSAPSVTGVLSLLTAEFEMEVGYVVLDILEDFMEDKFDDLEQPNSPLMEVFFHCLILVMKRDNSRAFILCLFATLTRFIHKFKNALFVSRSTSFCGDICYQLLRYANSTDGTARSAAASILYLMMKTNLLQTSNFARMRLQLTIAMSKYCGENHTKEYSWMRSTLEQVVEEAKKESLSSATLSNLGKHVEDIKNKLLKLIEDSLKIQKYDYDPEMTCDLYYQFSTFYFESPDLRVAWLENLSSYQKQRNNWEEAAMCKVLIAALIAEYLTFTSTVNHDNQKSKEGIPPNKEGFRLVCPSIPGELGLPPVDPKKAEEEGMYNNKTFSEEGFINQLSLAIRFLKSCSSFEACIDAYNLLVELYETKRDYVQLSSCFRDLKTICDAVHTQSNARVFSSYYWVMFYGSSWGEFESKSFIYKEPKGNTHLADVIERFMKQFSAKFKIENMRVLQPKRCQVELDKLSPSLCYFHVEPVTEYFEASEVPHRITPWERKFNLQNFLFEMPYTKSGKPSNDVLEQYKLKTILTVDKCFPYVNTRLEVVNKRNIVISPIETAIDVINKRTATIKSDLNAKPVDVSLLRSHLNESVSKSSSHPTPGVIKSFFAQQSTVEFPGEFKDNLKKHTTDLLAIVGVAIKLSKQLISQDEQEAQVKLEEEFNVLKKDWGDILKQQTVAASP